MSKPAKNTKPAPAGKRALNLSVDSALADTFVAYCAKNRQAGSVSSEVEEFFIRTIASKGAKYGLRLPAHFSL